MDPAAGADDGGGDDAIILASSIMPGVTGATLPGCNPGKQSSSPASCFTQDGNCTVLQVTQE